MNRLALAAVAVALTAGVFVTSSSTTLEAQERVSKPETKDFPRLVEAAKTAFAAEQYGPAIAHLRDAISVATQKYVTQIRAALPAASDGWKLQEDKSNDAAQLAGMGIIAGTNVSAEYRQEKGRGRMKVTIMANSPLAQMFSMWVGNPALLGKDSELVKYGAYNAVLKTRKDGSSYELQLLVIDDLVQVDLTGADDDFLFAMWNQAAVDRLAAVLK